MQVHTLQTVGAASVLLALGAGALMMPLTSASTDTAPPPAAASATRDAAASWAPAPVERDGLTTLATTDGTGLRLHTAGGVRDFVAGVDLGATTPGHLPGELAVTAEDYRRWFDRMDQLGIRAVRIYTIHPPAFYRELAAHNRTHPDTPLYLVQGVYLPDESYVSGGGTLYDRSVDEGFAAEVADATLAVRGALQREETPGRAHGTWDADVTPWLMAWIIGVEWDPEATLRTDAEHADAPAVDGPYFRSTPQASATERWLAKHLNALAVVEARNGRSAPIAFVNWPTTDPLTHPAEPQPAEDQVGVDANHVLATLAWPGGTFASYHAYPYYPDFLRFEPGLQTTLVDGRPDPYAGYLAALKRHHTGMPVMITELGVPSSIGSAHDGPLDRDQGAHREQDAMAINARMLQIVREQGLAGAFLFAWTDEWFKLTWNTVEHQVPAERRPLWHDPLTNEQFFGLLATDPNPLDGAHHVAVPDAASDIAQVELDADASFVRIRIRYRQGRTDRPLSIAVDTVPGGAPTEDSAGGVDPADYRIELNPAAGSAQALVRAGLDPARLDTWEPLPEAGRPWHTQRLITNRSYPGMDESTLETQEVGRLVRGTWQADSADPNSLATWQTTGDGVLLRIPWPMLGLADPSSRTALSEGGSPTTHVVDGIGLRFTVAGADPAELRYTWPTWGPDGLGSTERLKAGADVIAETFTELNR